MKCYTERVDHWEHDSVAWKSNPRKGIDAFRFREFGLGLNKMRMRMKNYEKSNSYPVLLFCEDLWRAVWQPRHEN